MREEKIETKRKQREMHSKKGKKRLEIPNEISRKSRWLQQEKKEQKNDLRREENMRKEGHKRNCIELKIFRANTMLIRH